MQQRMARRLTARTVTTLAFTATTFLAGCEAAQPTTPSSPAAPAEAAMALAARNGTLIRFEEITVPRDQPGTLEPCLFVNRGIYNAGIRGGHFSLEYTFLYTSGGTRVTKTFAVPMSEGEQIPPEPIDAMRNYLEVDNTFNVGEARFDIPGTVTASARLIWSLGRVQVVLDETRMSVVL